MIKHPEHNESPENYREPLNRFEELPESRQTKVFSLVDDFIDFAKEVPHTEFNNKFPTLDRKRFALIHLLNNGLLRLHQDILDETLSVEIWDGELNRYREL